MVKYDFINNDIFNNVEIGTEVLCILKDNSWNNGFLLKNENSRIIIYDNKYGETFLGKGTIKFIHIKDFENDGKDNEAKVYKGCVVNEYSEEYSTQAIDRRRLFEKLKIINKNDVIVCKLKDNTFIKGKFDAQYFNCIKIYKDNQLIEVETNSIKEIECI